MRLRNILAAIAAGGLILALLVCLRDPGFWPATIMIALVAAALLFERRRYGTRLAPPAGSVPTEERFVDPETGRMLRVWYDPATAERSYVPDNG